MVKFTITLSKEILNDKFVNCSPKERTSIDFMYDDYYPISEDYLVDRLRQSF